MNHSSKRMCLVVMAATVLLSTHAFGDHRPTLVTDAFYVGVRIDPGVAASAGWDLDIYLTRDRAFSLGVGLSVAALGTAVPDGRQQDVLLSVDAVRAKLGASVRNGEFRPYLGVGGGFSYVRLREHAMPGVTVIDAMGNAVTGTLRYPALDEFAPMLSAGGGIDWFPNAPVGVTLQMMSHFHLTGVSRMPDVWFETSLGIRFGL